MEYLIGHAARCGSDFTQAKKWHEKQLEMALAARDKIGEGRACSNLGIVYQLNGDYDGALKLHQVKNFFCQDNVAIHKTKIKYLIDLLISRHI